MENVNITDSIFSKKAEGYHFEENNFIASGEIMVHITLNEYRALVKAEATADQRIKKAEEKKYENEKEIEKLTAECAALKSELYELNKRIEDATANTESISE